MRSHFYLLIAHTLLLLGLIVPINSVTAGVPDELRTKLNEVETLFADIHKLVSEEGTVVREMQTTTNRELELRLRTEHQATLQKIEKKNELKLRTLQEAVDLLRDFSPTSRRDLEAVTGQAERIVTFLKWERDGILGDSDAPDELLSELGIDKLLEEAVYHLNALYSEERNFAPKKPPYSQEEAKKRQSEETDIHGPRPPGAPGGFVAWFDSQETAVKAALITAIVSIIGTVATVIVAAIRRRD